MTECTAFSHRRLISTTAGVLHRQNKNILLVGTRRSHAAVWEKKYSYVLAPRYDHHILVKAHARKSLINRRLTWLCADVERWCFKASDCIQDRVELSGLVG